MPGTARAMTDYAERPPAAATGGAATGPGWGAARRLRLTSMQNIEIASKTA